MTILLPTLAVAFAAFCVWLTVRIVNRRERWAKWTLAVTLSLPVLYVASFGPVVWATSWDGTTEVSDLGVPLSPKATNLYLPLYVMALKPKSLCHDPLKWWMGWGLPYGTLVTYPRAALQCAGMIETAEPVNE